MILNIFNLLPATFDSAMIVNADKVIVESSSLIGIFFSFIKYGTLHTSGTKSSSFVDVA